jgi:hypothetical protein
MTVRIANAQGFWGDRPDQPRRMLEAAEDLDYLTLDYLAELTMVIMARQQANDPDLGYAKDFVPLAADIIETALDSGVTIVANAGGVNPGACRDAVRKATEDIESPITIATVTGDDFRSRLGEFEDRLEDAFSGEPLPDDAEVVTANAYFGAFPVAEAIAGGADIVITGRVTDSALIMGPLVYEYEWDRDDYDCLGRSMITGHVIECGCQATGGNFHGEWRDIDFETIGYPIAEVEADGSTTITKPPGTGGMVTPETVAEQLLYEVGDPSAYLGPDVSADFQDVSLEAVGDDRVAVSGVRGAPPTDQYKASLHYTDRWQVRASIAYSNPSVLEKAERAVEYIENKIEAAGITPRAFEAELFGADAFHGGHANGDPEEIEVRIGIEVDSQQEGETFAKHVAPLGLGGPPAVVIQAGRPKPKRKYTYHPVLVPKDAFSPSVEVETK